MKIKLLSVFGLLLIVSFSACKDNGVDEPPPPDDFSLKADITLPPGTKSAACLPDGTCEMGLVCNGSEDRACISQPECADNEGCSTKLKNKLALCESGKCVAKGILCEEKCPKDGVCGEVNGMKLCLSKAITQCSSDTDCGSLGTDYTCTGSYVTYAGTISICMNGSVPPDVTCTGTACPNGTECSGTEKCSEGCCVPEGNKNCPEGFNCSDDVCAPVADVIKPTAENPTCAENVDRKTFAGKLGGYCKCGKVCDAGLFCQKNICLGRKIGDGVSCTNGACGTGLTCVNDKCIVPVVCTTTADCADFSDKANCNCKSGLCLVKAASEQGPAQQVNPTPIKDSCSIDLECKDGGKCVAETCVSVKHFTCTKPFEPLKKTVTVTCAIDFSKYIPLDDIYCVANDKLNASLIKADFKKAVTYQCVIGHVPSTLGTIRLIYKQHKILAATKITSVQK